MLERLELNLSCCAGESTLDKDSNESLDNTARRCNKNAFSRWPSDTWEMHFVGRSEIGLRHY